MLHNYTEGLQRSLRRSVITPAEHWCLHNSFLQVANSQQRAPLHRKLP